MPRIEKYPTGSPCWIELMSPDQSAAAEFYQQLFGWEHQENPIPDTDATYLISSLAGAAVAGIGEHFPDLAGHPAFWSVYLATEDITESCEIAARAGGIVEMPPHPIMEHGWMARVKDPTNARVGLWQPKNHLGTELLAEPNTPTWFELVTEDIPTAVNFYQHLGLGTRAQEMPDGSSYQLWQIAGEDVGGIVNPPMPGFPPHWTIYFRVAEIDAAVELAVQLGATVLAPTFEVPGVGQMAYLRDPYGAMFYLMETAGE